MKARFLALAALVLGLASCQNDFDGANVGAGGEVDFQLSVAAPELATRAGEDGQTDGQADLNSAYGAIDYLQADDEGDAALRTDWSDVNLRYTLEVYDKADSYAADVAPIKDRQVIIVDEYQPVTFELRLVPKRDYHFVVFADFVPQDVTDATQTSAIEAQRNIGLHHVIGNTLADITVKNDGINDECSDAYFATKDIVISNSAAQDIVLKRPYGKLRVIATDLHELNLNVNPAAVKVEYTAAHVAKFNAITGAIDTETVYETATYDSEYNAIYKEADKGGLANHFYTTGYDALEGHKYTNANGDVRHTHMTLFTDYILASDQQHTVQFTMTVYDQYDAATQDGRAIKTTTFNTDIPVQRNYLTTVIGNVLTTATEIEVRIDDNFAGEYTEDLWDGSIKAPAYDAETKTYSIYEASELAWVAAVVNGEITRSAAQRNFAGETVKLMNNIGLDLNGDRWTPIGAYSTIKEDTCFKGTFDGNGKIISNLFVSTEGNASAGLFANCMGTIKNLTVKDAVIYGHYKAGVIVADGTCAKLENCHVKNAKIVVTPINNDDANNVGGIVGYLSAEPTAYVKNCSVENAEITAYRKVAGIVGAANRAAVVTGNSVENVTITADQTAEYKEFKAAEVGEIAGYIHANAQVENNTVGENVKVIIKVDSNEEALPALTTKCKNLEVVLAAEVEVAISSLGTQTPGSGEYKLGNEDTETITIDLGGKKLNITTTYWSAIGAKNNDALFTIKNGTMTSTGNSAGTWNAWDLRFSNCNYAFEKVVFEKAVALDNAAKTTTMKNVTITDTHDTDTYGLWITAEGQTVTLDGCNIDMTPATDGRGIKIDEQYVDAPAKVTLNVANTTFKTEEKAAILVKSKAGADINISKIDITEVAADTVNAVWVDSDAKQYATKVNVTGASMVVEGVDSIDAQDTLNSAVQEANAVVQVKAGEYTFPKNIAEGVTIICEEGTVFNGTSSLNINGATVMGATFQNESGTAVSGTINGTIKNCVFDGSNAFRYCYAGETVVFENCVFTGDVYGVHFDGGSNDAIFRNCTLSGFNAFGAALTELTFEDCTFVANGRSGYNGLNMWGSTNLIRCEFTFDGSVTEWVDVCSSNKSFNIEDCTINGQPFVLSDLGIYGDCDVKLDGEHYGFASSNDGLKYTLEKNASIINLHDGSYELSGLNFAANNVTLKGADKANVVLNLEKSIYLQNKSITLENLTFNLNAGKNYTEQDFAFVHHATAFNLKNCNVNRLRLNVYSANIEDCTFTLDTSSGFDGYCIYYYGNDNSTVNVKNSTFATAGKGICIYSEHAKAYNLNVDKCAFTSSDSATDKAAIQMHTELGISGNVKITETTATGFADINGGLWNELNNNTKVTTDKFDIWVDGVQVH